MTNKTFSTKDFAVAATILSSDHRMIDYVIDDITEEMYFEFDDTEAVRELERSVRLGTAVVNVQKFVAAQKALKAMIYDKRRKLYANRMQIDSRRTAGQNDHAGRLFRSTE
ncbi:MAG TPA: hypothetical protein VGL38_01150 [bacterium]|jgi:hypothetical protein